MRKSLMSALAVASTALLAACGSSGGSGSADGATDANGNTSVQVGYVPFDDAAVLFLAKEHGFFAKHHLDVSLHQAASPTPIVASMQSGQYQFGFITAPVLINADLAKQGLKCVSVVDGQVDPNSDSAALVASKKSGISSIAQLSGKSVAVVQLSSLNLYEAQKLADDAGAKNVKFVSIPFPQMPQALESGRVDAAVVTSPFLQTALKQGAKRLAAPNSQIFPNGTVYCYGATDKYLAGHSTVANAFRDAINESTLYAKNHLSEEKATLVKYLGLSSAEAQAQKIASNYVPELNTDTLGQIQKLMKAQGAIKSTLDPKSLVWNPSS